MAPSSQQEDLKTGLAGQARSLQGLVEYQEDAIVSRIVQKAPMGSVTLFAFDAGQELSEHTTPFDALVYVFDGDADITISGKAHRVGKGEMLIMPADEPHALRAPGRFKMVLTMIRS